MHTAFQWGCGHDSQSLVVGRFRQAMRSAAPCARVRRVTWVLSLMLLPASLPGARMHRTTKNGVKAASRSQGPTATSSDERPPAGRERSAYVMRGGRGGGRRWRNWNSANTL